MKRPAAMVSIWIAALAIGAIAEPPLTPVANPQPIIEDLQRKMAALESVYLEFRQERHLKLFAEPLRSEGVMLMERPDQIRWEMTTPYQSILLGNHRSVAQFENVDNQWKKLRVGFPKQLRQVMNQMVLMHQGDIAALTKDYTLSMATGAVAVVTLEPKDETVRSFLSSLQVRMRPDFSATTEVVMNEPGGDSTHILFHREVRNVKFPEGTFDQNKPRDIAAIRTAAGVP
jgi:outer membrane lipoprotein-sorting protein